MRPPRIPSKQKQIETDERSHIGEDEEYKLTHDVWAEANRLRLEGKWTMQEVATKLGINLDDLLHDFDLHRRELESMDE